MMTGSATLALRRAGRLASLSGSLLVAAGVGAWCVVAKQLGDEKIVVPGNAQMLAGKPVRGPLSAYAEALVIQRNAARGSGGRTFADISDELRHVESGSAEEAELRKQSSSLQAAASLRASLMTSVLAFGVSALTAGVGVLFSLIGRQLRRGARR